MNRTRILSKLISIILCLFLSIATFAATSTYSLIVSTKDGKRHFFNLLSFPSITIKNSNFVITTNNSTIEFSNSDVQDFTFSDSQETNICSPTEKESVITFNSQGNIVISGIEPHSKINIFDITGQKVQCKISNINSNTKMLFLSNLNSGIYVISINGFKNFKITKK